MNWRKSAELPLPWGLPSSGLIQPLHASSAMIRLTCLWMVEAFISVRLSEVLSPWTSIKLFASLPRSAASSNADAVAMDASSGKNQVKRRVKARRRNAAVVERLLDLAELI